MTKLNQLEYLKDQLENQLNKRMSSNQFYRNTHWLITLITISSSAVISVIAGWQTVNSPYEPLNNVVLCLSALVTITSAWVLFFSPKESWLLEAAAYDNLRSFKSKIEFLEASGDAISKESIQNYFDEYQKIMRDYNARWQTIRAKG